jgi:hypothetical protein
MRDSHEDATAILRGIETAMADIRSLNVIRTHEDSDIATESQRADIVRREADWYERSNEGLFGEQQERLYIGGRLFRRVGSHQPWLESDPSSVLFQLDQIGVPPDSASTTASEESGSSGALVSNQYEVYDYDLSSILSPVVVGREGDLATIRGDGTLDLGGTQILVPADVAGEFRVPDQAKVTVEITVNVVDFHIRTLTLMTQYYKAGSLLQEALDRFEYSEFNQAVLPIP